MLCPWIWTLDGSVSCLNLMFLNILTDIMSCHGVICLCGSMVLTQFAVHPVLLLFQTFNGQNISTLSSYFDILAMSSCFEPLAVSIGLSLEFSLMLFPSCLIYGAAIMSVCVHIFLRKASREGLSTNANVLSAVNWMLSGWQVCRNRRGSDTV